MWFKMGFLFKISSSLQKQFLHLTRKIIKRALLETIKTDVQVIASAASSKTADIAKAMKKPKDVFFLDMGNHAKAIIATKTNQ